MSKELDGRIAVVLGWTGIRPSTFWGDHDLTGIPPGQLRTFVPRWSSDLDLMWELEAKLKQTDLFIAYAIALNREVLLAL